MQELVVGDQSGVIHIWNLQNDQSEQLIPEPSTSIQSISIDSQGLYMAAVNNKVRVEFNALAREFSFYYTRAIVMCGPCLVGVLKNLPNYTLKTEYLRTRDTASAASSAQTQIT